MNEEYYKKGLTSSEVNERIEKNLVNYDDVPPTKTTAKGEPKSKEPSVFTHKYDNDTKGVYGEISSKELKIAEI